MKFRTELKKQDYPFRIKHMNKLMFLGSCFSDEISMKFRLEGFDILSNPFGTLYNPVSICNSLEDIIEARQISANALVKHDSVWVSLQHNTAFRNTDPGKLLKQINDQTNVAHHFLKNTNYLFITLGTSWAYIYKKSGSIVANCQKLPSENFNLELLTISEIHEKLESTLSRLKVFNPSLEVILTISPVRHLKDGLVGNTKSKARLFSSLDGLATSYFPSYELILDDLRDYRYFADDLCHVNELGVEYVWQKVEEWLLDESSAKSRRAVLNWRKLAAHRVQGDEAAAERQLSLVRSKKRELLENYPFVILD